MTITGIISDILSTEQGEGRNGRWQKAGFVIETESKYPKKIAVITWGDLVNVSNRLIIGEKITASIEIESREYNGKWFTNIKAWKIKRETEHTPSDDYEEPIGKQNEPDDLPF